MPGADRGGPAAEATPTLVPPQPATANDSPVSDEERSALSSLLAQMYEQAVEDTEQRLSPRGQAMSGLLEVHRPGFVAASGAQTQGLDELVKDAVRGAKNAYQAGFEIDHFAGVGRLRDESLPEAEDLARKIQALAHALSSGRATLPQALQALDPTKDEYRFFVMQQLLNGLLRSGVVDLQSIQAAWSDAAMPGHLNPVWFVTDLGPQQSSPAVREMLIEGLLSFVAELEPVFADEDTQADARGNAHAMTLIARWLEASDIPWTPGQVFTLEYLFIKAARGMAGPVQAPDRQMLEAVWQGRTSPAEAANILKSELKPVIAELALLPHAKGLTGEELADIDGVSSQFAAFAHARGLLSPKEAMTLKRSINVARARLAQESSLRYSPTSEDLPAEALTFQAMACEAQTTLVADIHGALKHIQEMNPTDMASSPGVGTVLKQLVDAVEAQLDIDPVVERVLADKAPIELVRLLLLDLADTLVRRAAQQQRLFDYRSLLRPLLRSSPDERSIKQLAQRIDKAAGPDISLVVEVLEAISDHIEPILRTAPDMDKITPKELLDLVAVSAPYGQLAVRLGKEAMVKGPRAKTLSSEERRSLSRWLQGITATLDPFRRRLRLFIKETPL